MSMDLSLNNILAATRGKVLTGTLDAPVVRVSIDSRSAGPGCLFVPLVGTRADGHDYIAAARTAGAACLVKKGHPASGALAGTAGPALIEVDDPLAALGDLAAFWRRRFSAKVVAITGSNGKTSTKEMASCIVERKFRTMKNPGNFNNLIGLPLSLFQLDGRCEVAVLELGMSEPGEIARLAHICDPDIGIITNIGPSHLEQLKTIERIAAAKGELFAALGPGDTALVNRDDARVAALGGVTQARRLHYGLSSGEVHASAIRQADGPGMQFVLHVGDEKAPVQLAVPGGQFVINAVAAAAIAAALGMGIDDIRAGLEAFSGVPGRMEIVRLAGCTFINDAYNANPVSTRAALASLAGFAPGRRTIAVLGDMLELGPTAADLHGEIGRAAAELQIGQLFITGDFSGDVRSGAIGAGMNPSAVQVCAGLEDVSDRLRKIMRPGDAILLKGSRRMKMEQILTMLGHEAAAGTAQ